MKFLSAQNVPVKKMNFPRRETTIGGLINSYLQSQSELSDEAIHLLFAANRWEVRKEILETLKSGTTVVCDRYAFSGVAYTAAKEVKTIDWCKAPDRGLPSPDKVGRGSHYVYVGRGAQEAQRVFTFCLPLRC